MGVFCQPMKDVMVEFLFSAFYRSFDKDIQISDLKTLPIWTTVLLVHLKGAHRAPECRILCLYSLFI
jgi:hypothetical protein